jgi:hypothetical protein
VPDHLASKFENNSHFETQGKARQLKADEIPEPILPPEFDPDEARAEAEAITQAAEEREQAEAAEAAKAKK